MMACAELGGRSFGVIQGKVSTPGLVEAKSVYAFASESFF